MQVRYGAERVFASEASNITDEDVDALIAKGEAATKELNDKLQAFTNDAMRFTMDGGMNGGWPGGWGSQQQGQEHTTPCASPWTEA